MSETLKERAVLALSGECRKGTDGFLYNDSGERVVIRWLDFSDPAAWVVTENCVFEL